jgi:hypothetical protein
MSTRYLQSFLNLFPGHRRLILDFKKCIIRAHKCKLQFKFLRECKEECVIPKTLTTSSLSKISNNKFGLVENVILNAHIRNAQREAKEEFKQLSTLKWEFATRIPHDWKHGLKNYIYNGLRKYCSATENRLCKKLNNLIGTSKWNSIGNRDNYINLSDRQLTNNEHLVMSLGLKFNNSTKKPDIIAIEAACKKKVTGPNDESTNMNIAKGIMYAAYMHSSSLNYFPKRFNKALCSLRKDPNLHITRADKSKIIVIMNKIDYCNRMETMLDDRNTYELLKSNPLERVNADYNRNIRNILVNNDNYITHFKSIGKSLPYLYGTAKIHKPGNKMRPIIGTTGSASYKLSKFLAHMLQSLVGTISSAHIQDSSHFISKLTNISDNTSLEDYNMVSFDVASLFTTVPVADVLEFLRAELLKHAFTLPISVILQLTRLCVVDTCFVFNDRFYRQKFGMQMGNCLSPVLANIYMEFFESRLALSIMVDNSFWLRYVDDIFSLMPKNVDINLFLIQLNNVTPSIKFTYELEDENKIPFLDTLIIREEEGFSFKVFRKLTNNYLIINNHSHHGLIVKHSALRAMFLRALKICSPQHLAEEVNVIYEIGEKNGFDKSSLNLCLKNAKVTHQRVTPKEPFENKNMICIPYHPSFNQVIYPLKVLGFNLTFSYPNTIGKSIIRNSPFTNSGSVYTLPCKCGQFYVGQTCKPLAKRMLQHRDNVAKNNQSSAVNLHSNTCLFPIDYSDAREILKCNFYHERILMETACIQLTMDRNFNSNQGLNTMNPLLLHIFNKQYRIQDII